MKRTVGEEFETLARDWLAQHPSVRHEWRLIRSRLAGPRLDLVEALSHLGDLLQRAGILWSGDRGSRPSADELETLFAPLALRDGGVLVLNPMDAVSLIYHAWESRLPILGIDAFRLGPDWIQPVMSESIGYTDDAGRVGAWAEAVGFITNRQEVGFVFGVIIGRTPVPSA
ncbi:MAG TPA: hypothetical protein VK636_19720 [Gemmatimonadaceae bacterium]|nr:hypothetical protein [Gemmatimonadaceae bacterium]